MMAEKRAGYTICLLVIICLAAQLKVFAQEELKPVKLAEPRLERGALLMQALKMRHSGRSYSSKPIPLEVLSDLLWAAGGINRPETGKRTAPTAMDAREIDIYVADRQGIWLFDPKENMLLPVLSGDFRAQTGIQEYVADAAINLLYVADFSRMWRMSEPEKEFYAATDTGFISQNVYLYCASEGLETVVRGWFDRAKLAKLLKLNKNQKVILTQSIGYK